MKKLFSLICTLILAFTLASCGSVPQSVYTPPRQTDDTVGPVSEGKHLILNQDGTYGGSINEELYGKGAPLNGEYDQKDSGYYSTTDYYNLPSTSTRTMIPHFASYQQRMADSSGIACALMIMHYSGEDVRTKYTEQHLVELYEEFNETTIYGNGTTEEGLVNLFTHLGYAARAKDYIESGANVAEKISSFTNFVQNHLNEGRLIMVRFHDGVSYRWRTIIGIDNMGTDLSRDDVLILADPLDILDHYQDGYYLYSVSRLYRWWEEVQDSGEVTDTFSHVVVAPKTIVKQNVAESDPMKGATIPERHLLLNEDGSFGGTRDEELYGVIPEKNGDLDHTNKSYYIHPDYYNLGSTDSRSLLSGFSSFQQTMASSCGICSTMMVLHYYGVDINTYNEVWLVEKYEELNDKTVKGSGVGSSGLKKLVDYLGYSGVADSFSQTSYVNESSKLFPTYASFVEFVKSNIDKGTPIPVSWKPINGHWEVIIGIDTMGTDYIYDDVIILADSHDTYDHYQDGYNTIPAVQFYGQWMNSSHTYNQQYCLFDKK